MAFTPFAEGPTRPKEILSLGFYRTGSHSLQAALTILGYSNVFHSSAIATTPEKWPGLAAACDANIASLPGYTGQVYTRADWDAYFGPCEALTDVTPFSEQLLEAYPEAKVIMVKRDFDSWMHSFLRTLVMPSSDGVLAWLSGNVFEPVLGLPISKTAWKMYMGLIGVSRLSKTKDRDILKAAYDAHYRRIQKLVPKEKLLELDLKDLDWKPLCEFLGKKVPNEPFPRLNESKVFVNEFRKLHLMTLMGGSIKILSPVAVAGAVLAGSMWYARSKGYIS